MQISTVTELGTLVAIDWCIFRVIILATEQYRICTVT